MAEGGPEERVAQEAPVHLNRDFRVLWLSRALGQTGHQTASFGSLIVLAVAGPFVGPAASVPAPTLVARDRRGA